jgi:Mrp family chromosome partitioning ATPase
MLIDTDFTPHSVTGLLRTLKLPISAALHAGPGLSDYLSGDTEDFLDIVYPLGKTVYGSFIPAGDPVHDTGFQFSHRNLGQLEGNLSPNYNFVLYALPSVEQSYDAIAVSRTLDGVLLMAHPGVTSLEQIQSTVRELASVDCRVLGILVQPLKQ